MNETLSDLLWGKRARLTYLLAASAILIFMLLGAREIWTQEQRWAYIVGAMFERNDFLHPYLEGNMYYDKPLLSYWLIAAIAKLSGSLNEWVLRLPSALSGLSAIISLYFLGNKLIDKRFGFLSAWMLLTTFYFLFWARVSSADMLNLAGTLLAITWYFYKRSQATFFDYAVFFLIIAETSLCKGLIGAVVPLIAVSIDMLLQKSLRRHLSIRLFAALIPAVFLYLLPFLISSYFERAGYSQNGLYLVYRENFLRYFQPFDHRGPIYTYLIYLPVYLLPWTFFFIPALYFFIRRYRSLPLNVKWIFLTLAALFLFFTFSGSRRSYYVLSMLPFGILLTAEWLLPKVKLKIGGFVIAFYILMLLVVDLTPAWYYHYYGIKQFTNLFKNQVVQQPSLAQANIIMLDAENKLGFYLQWKTKVRNLNVLGNREDQNQASLVQNWPFLKELPKNTIFITRKRYQPLLAPYFKNFKVVEMDRNSSLPFTQHNNNFPIAYIPLS